MAARWHPHDLTILRVSWYRGDPGGDIAARLGRSKQAVLTMRWVLRLPLSIRHTKTKRKNTAMTDEEFLSYCYHHADTPRCGFVPEQIARLLRLAGLHGQAQKWDDVPNHVVNLDPTWVRCLVGDAWREATGNT